jgi:hypothetical protein
MLLGWLLLFFSFFWGGTSKTGDDAELSFNPHFGFFLNLPS